MTVNKILDSDEKLDSINLKEISDLMFRSRDNPVCLEIRTNISVPND